MNVTSRIAIIGGAALAALLPAGLGLAANPTLSARTPVPPAEVQLASGRTPSSLPTVDDSPTASPTSSPTQRAGDDKGGRRNRGGGADDSATHNAGDDNGGRRAPGVNDDPAGHDAGDDKGGDDRGGGGSDDSGSDDHGSGGHGSDD